MARTIASPCKYCSLGAKLHAPFPPKRTANACHDDVPKSKPLSRHADGVVTADHVCIPALRTWSRKSAESNDADGGDTRIYPSCRRVGCEAASARNSRKRQCLAIDVNTCPTLGVVSHPHIISSHIAMFHPKERAPIVDADSVPYGIVGPHITQTTRHWRRKQKNSVPCTSR